MSTRARDPVLTDTPFGHCLTTVSLADLGPGRCQVAWSATFEADGIPANEAVALPEGALADNCLALSHRRILTRTIPLAVAPGG